MYSPFSATVVRPSMQLSSCVACVRCSVDETRVAVSVALTMCCMLAVVPLCMWALCYVESFQTLGHCVDMQ